MELIASLAEAAQTNAHSEPPEGFSKGVRVQHVALNTKEWGRAAQNERENQIIVKEITIPFIDPEKPDNKYLVQTLTYDFETPSLDEKEKETLTLVAWGGGGSDAYSVVSYATKLRDAVLKRPDFPYNVHLVIMPHLIGQARIGDFEKSENTLAEAAKISSQILKTPQLNVTDNIAFIGFSAGGAMATEVAAICQDDPHKTIHFAALCDAAGMADIESIAGKVAKTP